MTLIVVVKPNFNKQLKRWKLRKILRKSQPNFEYSVKKIESQAKNGFLIKITCILLQLQIFKLIQQDLSFGINIPKFNFWIENYKMSICQVRIQHHQID